MLKNSEQPVTTREEVIKEEAIIQCVIDPTVPEEVKWDDKEDVSNSVTWIYVLTIFINFIEIK